MSFPLRQAILIFAQGLLDVRCGQGPRRLYGWGAKLRQPARAIQNALIEQRTGRPLRVNCLWSDRRRGAHGGFTLAPARWRFSGGDGRRLARLDLLQSHREKPLLPALRGR